MASVDVSIVVPLYNKGCFIERSLRSIARQSMPEFRVVVVDDGSTDDGPERVREFIADTADPRFRMVSQSNSGPGAARNRGIAETTSPFLAFLDADDRWSPNYLERSLKALRRAGGGVASVTSAYWEEPGRRSTVPLWRSRKLPDGLFRASPEIDTETFVHALAFMTPWATIIHRDVLLQYGGFYGSGCLYGEDAHLFLKVLLNEAVLFNMEPLVHYHTEASELADGRIRLPPTEPFLENPDSVREVCPAELQELLRSFLAFRALKRACLLGYWGRADEAKALVQRFSTKSDWRLRWYLLAKLSSLGALGPIGRALRSIRGPREVGL